MITRSERELSPLFLQQHGPERWVKSYIEKNQFFKDKSHLF